MMPRPAARDDDIGLTGFYTNEAPIGGRLKVRVSDFVVEEIGGEPPESPDGRYACAIVRLTNWETNRFVRDASDRLGISRKKVHFSGTKDKRGITTRVFTFEAPTEAVADLANMPGVEMRRVYRTDLESALGQHWGNRFEIVVRDLQGTERDLAARFGLVRGEAESKGGYPNVFGPQRFGALRATTHLVGERILRGDFRGAVHAYLGSGPIGSGLEEVDEWSRALEAQDYARLLAMTSPGQTFERAMLNRLVTAPTERVEALLALPKNLQLLFVSAAQSLLFNQTVCRRIASAMPLHEAVEGDLIAAVESGEVRDEWIPVTSANRGRVNDEIRLGRAVVTGLLPGTEAPMADGEPGRIERAVLEESGLTKSNFVVPEHLDWSSRGTRRALLMKPQNMEISVESDDLHPGKRAARLRFELPRGAYATSVLREFLKLDDLVGYG